jgi:arginyl-tRNA--protein-N-Asp/Glu arginylyltransferase
MKIIYKEYASHDYSSYRFPYCVYGIKEEGDSYHDLYSRGFLPYSNDTEITDEIYYLARSVRIDLKQHVNKFKQNNVFNKFAKVFGDQSLTFQRIPKEKLSSDASFIQWCLEHSKDHFLKPERLKYILERPYLKEVLKITCGDRLMAYLLIVDENRDFIHVWFSFYDTLTGMNDFGKWMLLNTIDWSKMQGYQYFYIGTCYPPGGFYKLTLSPSTGYFDGEKWSPAVSELKVKMQANN